MADYLFYWKPETVNDTPEGSPLVYSASEQFDRLESGDVLWIVTSAGASELTLVGRLAIAQVTASRSEAQAWVGRDDLWEAGWYALAHDDEARPKQNIDISRIATELRFAGTPNRLADWFTGQHLQSMRKLTAESAAFLDQQWEPATVRANRNPPWQRDELILALDLYMRLDRTVADDNHPEVVALSRLLNELPIQRVRPDAERFRNPNGVALKLANFRAIEQPGHGMARGNRLDRVVWDEFASDPARLRALAEAIRAGVTIQDRHVDVITVEESDEEEFPEGRIIYRLHRARERNRVLVERKKTRVLAQHGRLSCEVCGFDFAATYGSLGEGYIECHHAVALHESPEERRSRLEDLVLVCSNCHRMIHRKRPWLDAASVRVMLLQSANLRSVEES